MRSSGQSVEAFAELPDPGGAGSLDDLVELLGSLKSWAGDPSYEWITGRVNAAWRAAGRPPAELVGKSTVVSCFRTGRRRLAPDLVVSVVAALHPDVGYVAQWQQALRVVGGRARAAGQVRVQDTLPPDLAGFTGRAAELERLRAALPQARGDRAAVVISAIDGMAGVGKTQLAIHAGHLLIREKTVDRVLFVNLRGFHPDPAQPPADPGAVLDGFLRLLGVPGQQIPHELAARVATYRARLAGTRTLIVLDNAVDAEQVRPLLPGTAGCPVLVTSRRSLTGLDATTCLTVDMFAPGEALAYLARAAASVPVGTDPQAAARIARRCGQLPLALGLVAAHIQRMPGWTLTDHADRLDEHHQTRRLDSGVQLALDLSYRQLPADRQRLLRLTALHPAQDLDTHAAAALADTDLPTALNHLHHLHRDHLLQQTTPGRYALHDLVRAYAADKATDEDTPPARRVALTRLFDYYLATTATAMNALHPAEAHRLPRIPPPTGPSPSVALPEAAHAWLETERPTLVAVVGYTATCGWFTHAIRLSRTLFRYLEGGHHTDALIVYQYARDAARHHNDPAGHAHALASLAATHSTLGRYGVAVEHLQQALHLFRQTGDPVGQARALGALAGIDVRLGHYRAATDRYSQALTLCRQGGDSSGEAIARGNLGDVELRRGRYQPAADLYRQALAEFRQTGHSRGQAWALTNIAEAEAKLGRHGPAAEHLQQALTLYRQLGNRSGEATTLIVLGDLYNDLGQPARATEQLRQALTVFREVGEREGEAAALNGLGEAAHTRGHPTEALTYHTAALTTATDIGVRSEQARAHAGLGQAHHSLGNPARARQHYQHALSVYTDLGLPQADQIRIHLSKSYRPIPVLGEVLADAATT